MHAQVKNDDGTIGEVVMKLPSWFFPLHATAGLALITWGVSVESRLQEVNTTQDAVLKRMDSIDTTLRTIDEKFDRLMDRLLVVEHK